MSTALVGISEICLIGIISCVLLTLIPLAQEIGKPNPSEVQNSSEAEPVLQICVTSSGQDLWIQNGRDVIAKIDVNTNETRFIYRSEDSSIDHWSVSSDGSTWLLCQHDREVQIYRNQELILDDWSAGDMSLRCALSGGGNRAVCLTGRNEIRSWDLSASPPVYSKFLLHQMAHRIAINPSGTKLFASTYPNEIQVYDLNTGEMTSRIANGHCLSNTPVFSPDGQWMVVAAGESLRRYEVDTCQQTWEITRNPGDSFHNVAVSGDGRWIAGSRLSKGIEILDSATGELQHTYDTNSLLEKVCFANHDDRLISGGIDGSIHTWWMPSLPSVKESALSN